MKKVTNSNSHQFAISSIPSEIS